MNSKHEVQPIVRNETDKLTIVGAGFSGVMMALLAHLEYKAQNKNLRITLIGDQNPTDSPASNLCASISHNEIAAVTPSPAEAKDFIEKLYTTPGGLADDLKHLNTPKTRAFIEELYKLAENPDKLKNDQKVLEKYGEYCMLLWRHLMDIIRGQQDPALLEIFESFSSLLLPAAPGEQDDGKNHRVDIYMNTPNAVSKTSSLVKQLQEAGYTDSRLLSPNEYLNYLPYAQEFVEQHTNVNDIGERVWKDDVSIARRPAGRINANQFMTHITAYLKNTCGEYINENGQVKSYFRIKNRKVKQLICEKTENESNLTQVVDLSMAESITNQPIIDTHRKDRAYEHSFYAINPGSRVHGTDDLGIKAPHNALFSGTYMQLRIPIHQLSPSEQNIHINLALRCGNGANGVHTSVAQFYPDPMNRDLLVVHIAGTKTFCGDTEPTKQAEFGDFVYDRLLIQLNMLRIAFPNLLKPVLGEQLDQELTREIIDSLVKRGIAKVGVESRNVSTTNSPYVGPVVLKNGDTVQNAGLCHAPSSAGIAYIANMMNTLEAAGIQCSLFKSIPNQKADDIEAAASLLQNNPS
jgi:hypothetical protein